VRRPDNNENDTPPHTSKRPTPRSPSGVFFGRVSDGRSNGTLSPMRPATRASTACLLALSACGLERPARPQEAPAPTGPQPDVAFSEYSPLSSSAGLVRRLLRPLAAAQKLLTEIDVRFGGLAAPRSLVLQSALN